jgi:uncharacterized protein
MRRASRGFQVFVKPAGAVCNLRCRYCYYVEKELPAAGASAVMPDDLLEEYVVQHIAACPDDIVRFSWHGGEPTVAGLDFFRKAVAFEKKHAPRGRRIANGLQTNGVLIDEAWGRFFAEERFSIGLSLDGPREIHDRHRLAADGKPTFEETMRGYGILRRHAVPTDLLCVVSRASVSHPLEIYRFYKEIGAAFVNFLPLVERATAESDAAVAPDSVPPAAWGGFLCTIFDEWVAGDIGRIKVQVIEEAARTAFGQEHSLCIFRPTCGDIPVVERNGDFYSCDHFVDPGHLIGNIREAALADLLESPAQRRFGEAKRGTLPAYCLRCEVFEMCHGECPKNRFLRTPEGEGGLNYLCEGYRRFFNHCRPFVDAVAAEWRRGTP